MHLVGFHYKSKFGTFVLDSTRSRPEYNNSHGNLQYSTFSVNRLWHLINVYASVLNRISC